MSPKLEEALRAWVEKPAKEHGLCQFVYELIYELIYEEGCSEAYIEANKTVDELVVMFKAEDLCELSPFHDSFDEYEQECENGTCHVNPKRVAWVKAKLGMLDESKT